MIKSSKVGGIFTSQHVYSDLMLEAANECLEDGLAKLGLEMGIVCRVDGLFYEIIAVKSPLGIFIAGEYYSLKNTVCQEIVESKSPIALSNFNAYCKMCKHPLYVPSSLESYIGAPIIAYDGVWGIVNFTSMSKRHQNFLSREIELVENYAATISRLINAHAC